MRLQYQTQCRTLKLHIKSVAATTAAMPSPTGAGWNDLCPVADSAQTPAPPGDVTLRSYERGAALYRDTPPPPLAEHTEFLDTFARLVAGGEVLELGSGTGSDALYLGRCGVRVIPTDGARSFVEMMRDQGLPARYLDVRRGEFGGPYRGVLAIAMLLHLSRGDLKSFLKRVSRAVAPDGVLGFTLKEGDGDGWSYKKLGLPRHFTYWREPDLRDLLAATGWEVTRLQHVQGHHDLWLFVLAKQSSDATQ